MRLVIIAAVMFSISGCGARDDEIAAAVSAALATTTPDVAPSQTTTTSPSTTTTTTPPPTTTTEAPPPIHIYALHLTLLDEVRQRPLGPATCEGATRGGALVGDIPSATFSVADGSSNIIGLLVPERTPGDNCTFFYTGEFEELPDIILIRGPRMQQNGFPVRSEDFYRASGDRAPEIVVAHLTLNVNTRYLD